MSPSTEHLGLTLLYDSYDSLSIHHPSRVRLCLAAPWFAARHEILIVRLSSNTPARLHSGNRTHSHRNCTRLEEVKVGFYSPAGCH